MDWNEALEEFLARKAATWTPKTRRWYGSFLVQLAAWCADRQIDVAQFRRRDMEIYIGQRRDEVSQNTLRSTTMATKVFTRFWTGEGLYKIDPLREMALPTREERHVPVPRAADLDRLLNAITERHGPHGARSNHLKPRVRAYLRNRDTMVILLLVETGLRISEALALTTDDVRLDAERAGIIVRQSKTHMARTVPITAELSAELTQWLTTRSRYPFETRLLFPTLTGQPLRADSFHQTVDRYWKLAGLPPRTLHSLRHFALTALARHGSILAAQYVAGHKDVKTTSRYLTIHEDQAREDVAAVGTLKSLNRVTEKEKIVRKRVVR